MGRLETFRQHEAAVAAWNAAYPIGTAVMVSKDDHSVVRGVTTSAAWMLGGHTAVIKVTGISGCFALARVTADKLESAAPALLTACKIALPEIEREAYERKSSGNGEDFAEMERIAEALRQALQSAGEPV